MKNSHFRFALLAVVALLLAMPATLAAQTTRGGVVPQQVANRLGLKRAWFTQVEIERASSRIGSLVLHRDLLFVQTDRGVVQALEAETGRTRWVAQIGRREHPTMAPAVNDQYLALINGSQLYVVERDTGKRVWDRQTKGGPGAGPALSKSLVFVPMIDGRIEGYELDVKNYAKPPWIYASNGRALVQPRTTDESLCWPTDRGFLYVGRAEKPGVRFRVETRGIIDTRPAYAKPYLYGASHDGNVYAVHELSGNQLWRFSAGDPISQPPVAVGNRLYICPERAGMFCLAADTGEEVWWAPGVNRFVAASGKRIFGIDGVGRLHVLDQETGSRLGVLDTSGLSLQMVNNVTDRIFIGTESGLVQCLHDLDQVEPLYHRDAPEKPAGERKVQQRGLEDLPAAEPAGEAAPAAKDDEPNPFDAPPAGQGDDAPAGDDNPFDAPAEGANDNPFGAPAAGDDDPFR